MPVDTSKVASNARLKSIYTGDPFIEKMYCSYAPFDNTLLVASREFVEDISEVLRKTGSIGNYDEKSRVPVWFRPCEYDNSFFDFHPDNGTMAFTYMKGVEGDILSSENKVYVSVAIAKMIKNSTIIIQPAIQKSVKLL